MKQKTKLIAGIIILVVLIIVAAVLYKTLSSKYKDADGSGQQTDDLPIYDYPDIEE